MTVKSKYSAVLIQESEYPINAKDISITSVQILAMNATPVELVAAPGVGKTIELLSAFGILTFVGPVYATNTILQLTGTGGSADFISQNSNLLPSGADEVSIFKISTEADGMANQFVDNKPLLIEVRTGDPTGGASTLVMHITYRIVDTP